MDDGSDKQKCVLMDSEHCNVRCTLHSSAIVRRRIYWIKLGLDFEFGHAKISTYSGFVFGPLIGLDFIHSTGRVSCKILCLSQKRGKFFTTLQRQTVGV